VLRMEQLNGANWDFRVYSYIHTDNKIMLMWHMGRWTLGMVGMCWQLDLGIIEVFSSLNGSMCLGHKFITMLILHSKTLFGILIYIFFSYLQLEVGLIKKFFV